MKNKNIVIVTHYYPPHIGGIEMVAHNQAKRLAESGHKVTVVTSRIGKEKKAALVDGVNIIRVKAFNGLEKLSIPYPVFYPAILPALIRTIKKADVVHVHDAFYMSSLLGAACARWYKKPIVLTQHVALISHPSKFVVAMEKLVYVTTGSMIFNWSDLILTLNDRVEDFLVAGGVPREKLVSLPNGVDTELFCPVDSLEKRAIKAQFGLSKDKKIALFVGRFVPKKGFDKVLAAQSHKYQIVFAGGDTPEHHGDQVVFLGRLSQTKLARIYQAADVFILPSSGEGFPLSVQEAMATGLPVITTKDAGYKRYNLNERHIYLIDDPTESSVRYALETIIHDDERMQTMGAYSHRYAHAHFGWPFVMKRLERIYDDIVQTTETENVNA